MLKRYKIIVCKTKTCRERFSKDTFQEFEKLIRRENLQKQILLAEGGCYGYCELGPNVLVLGPLSEENWQKFTQNDEEFMDSSIPSQFFHGIMPNQCAELLKKLLNTAP